MIGESVQILYIFLCVVGTALPLSQFVPWLSAHGFDVPLLLLQATSGHIAAFAWSDVLVSGVVVAVFVVAESARLAMRYWWVAFVLSCGRPFLGVTYVPVAKGEASCFRKLILNRNNQASFTLSMKSYIASGTITVALADL